MTYSNPIVDEVRRVREEILESYGGDVIAMMRDAKKRQFESGHEVVRDVPKATHYVCSDGEIKPILKFDA